MFFLDMYVFNEFEVKNYRTKKSMSFFVFMEGVQLPHDQFLVPENRNVHCKVLSSPYRNSKFNILANFNLVLTTT